VLEPNLVAINRSTLLEYALLHPAPHRHQVARSMPNNTVVRLLHHDTPRAPTLTSHSAS
jgi:hypothetical protein